MTQSLEEVFAGLKARDEAAYIAHIYAGDPNMEFTIKLAETLCRNGADILEFGIPFSDPIADGPVLQRACERALANGATPAAAIEAIRELRRRGIRVPIAVTTYYNIAYRMGVERFMERIRDAGAQAAIVPDVPLEEARPLMSAGRKYGIRVIFLAAPTTTDERLARMAAVAGGFIYIVSVSGVTGVRESVADATLELIQRVKKVSRVPVVAGFGVSKQEHARTMLRAGADGVITGSALAKIYERYIEGNGVREGEALAEVARFARETKNGLKRGYK